MRNAKVLIFGECFARRGVKLFKFERLVADENQITPVTDHERLMLLRGWLGIGTWCSFFFGLTLRLLSGLDFCLLAVLRLFGFGHSLLSWSSRCCLRRSGGFWLGFNRHGREHCRQKLLQLGRKLRRFFRRRKLDRNKCVWNVGKRRPGRKQQSRGGECLFILLEKLYNRLELLRRIGEFDDRIDNLTRAAGAQQLAHVAHFAVEFVSIRPQQRFESWIGNPRRRFPLRRRFGRRRCWTLGQQWRSDQGSRDYE